MLVDEHDLRKPDTLPLRPRITDATVDGSQAFASAIDETLDDTVLHRCLQHLKTNVDRESRKKASLRTLISVPP